MRLRLVRTLMSEAVMKVLEGEMFKTKGMIPRYTFQAGAILREPGWSFELLKSLCDRNSVMEMIIQTLVHEVVRLLQMMLKELSSDMWMAIWKRVERDTIQPP